MNTMVNAESKMVSAISFGVFWRLAPFDQTDHPVNEGVAPLCRDVHHDAVRQHLGATGHRRAVASRLTDDGRRFTGDGRFVDRRDALDDVAVGRDDVARLADDRVPLGQQRRGHPLLRAVGQQTAGLGLRTHLPQRLGLSLAAALGHGLSEVGEQHRQEQPDGDAPVEEGGVRQGLDEGDDRADQHHEHHRVLDLHPRVELLEGADDGLTQDLAVEQAA
jgi:hypothetical protein